MKFPVDVTDIQALLSRAADAVEPLLDKLYEKAFLSHLSIQDPSINKFDRQFRLENAVKLLK